MKSTSPVARLEPGPTNHDYLARDREVVLRPWALINEPLPIVEARDCYVTDAEGKRYLDFTSGYFVNVVGHSHPRILAAAKAQLDRVSQVSGRHTTPALIALAEKLIEISPASLERVFFTTGGSESCEFAMKLARQFKGKPYIAVLDNAFHGLTLGALAACGSAKYRKTAGVPLGDYVYRVPIPYLYRDADPENAIARCLERTDRMLADQPETAALLGETVQSVGGLRFPQEYWDGIAALCKKHDVLLILDEIQSGLGRTGTLYAAEQYGLQPDIMTSAKGLSGGVGSLGAVMVSGQVGEHFAAGTTPTNGGNAISAAAGLALIEVLIDEGIPANARAMGEYLTDRVEELDDPWVGDIRFSGLMGGVELVLDRATKEPVPKPMIRPVLDHLHQAGNLLTASGPLGNVLRLQPPLTFTRQMADGFVADLAVALKLGRDAAAGAE